MEHSIQFGAEGAMQRSGSSCHSAKGKTMIHLMKKKDIYHANKRLRISSLAILICCCLAAPAQTSTHTEGTGGAFSVRATHLLGFENAKSNCTGTLTIQNDLLQFQQNDETP